MGAVMDGSGPAAAQADTAALLGLVERLSYGLGDLGFSLPYNMASAFLLYYYTVVIKLPAGAVGTIFLLARLLDAVIDMLVGIAVDRTHTRWGRARPYLLFATLPYAVALVAVFSVPAWSLTAQLIYAFLTFKSLGILMSLGAIPFTAMMPMMTAAPDQRLKLGGMRSIGTSVSVVLGTAATMPLVAKLGHGNEHAGFFAVACVFALVSLASIAATFWNCRERIDVPEAQRPPVLPDLRDMLCNRAWLVAFAFCLVYFIRFGAMIALTTFFAIDVMRRPWMISVMLPAVSGMLLLSSFFAPPLLARLGIRRGCFTVLATAMALFALLPFCEGQPVMFLGVYICASLATSITITATFSMIADAVDYHEWLYGGRREGLIAAGTSLATKIGVALGSAGAAYMLAYADYRAGAVSPFAREAIRWTYYGGTIALVAVQIIIIAFWPMDGLHGRIRAEIAARQTG